MKPELFTHGELFDAERESKLPLRLAFVALFTCCDREGRFKWRPRELKLACLPFDDVDFSRVLDALATRGFIVRYASDYGCIPSWERHQVINNREGQSEIPTPTESDLSTRAPRVPYACPTPVKGKGREGKGTGKEGEGNARHDAGDGFDEFYSAYPNKKAKGDAINAWAKLTSADRALCLPAIQAQVRAAHFRGRDGQDYTPYPATWLNARRWEDEIKTALLNIGGGMTREEAEAEMTAIRIKHGRDPVMGSVDDEECSRALLVYRGVIKEPKSARA